MTRWAAIGIVIIVLAATLGTVTAQAPPDASEAIAKQIGWLVIQNANLQAQIEDLKKKVAACPDKSKDEQK